MAVSEIIYERLKRISTSMIEIKALDPFNLSDAGQCDGMFLVDNKLVLSVENDIIHYTIASTPPYEKQYPSEETDWSQYIANPDKAVFLAYIEERIAGQIILSHHWNHYAYIDDIVVDRKSRRLGVGRALLEQAKQWAMKSQRTGVMLETQNVNVGACRLYEKCGFELAGFDRHLYHGQNINPVEIALYWYWHPETPSDPLDER